MKIVKKPDGFWIISNRDDVMDMGPYDSKDEATKDMEGVERSLKSLEPRKR